ncbi:AraC family transcriptional regulator [Paenibacillus flagellatus]|uniref:AraC family transcriptional regulator n=1 Tax=Paenibacillus flagellatus TaxID=2211139 RepID=A0A2V5KIP9_9BACL|nr:AraC family transcriptional regulator [Paenibacillus flagellatus]PYI54380.1 AraC family transcriptional regulator [Paenibacillus flagellatus]
MATDRTERGGGGTEAPPSKRADKRNAFDFLQGRYNELERHDIRFRWGDYGFRVLRFHWTTFAPSKVIGFHQHDEFEFHFIPRGKGIVIMDNIRHPFQEGMFYLTGPGVEHCQEADEREGMDELCLHIDIVKLREDEDEDGGEEGGSDRAVPAWGADSEAEEAEECVRLLRELPRRPEVDRYKAMDGFMTAFRAWADNETGLYTTVKQSIIQILLRSVRAYGDKQTEPALPTRDMNAYRIQLASRFIQANSTKPIALEDVAEKLRISGRQLQRIFRDNGLGSFSDYVEKVRLGRVCEALLDSDEPIERIALDQGFSSANYLYYVFKKRFGTTPGAYRDSRRNEAKHST